MVLDEKRTCKRHRRKRSYYRVRGATKQVNPISNYYRSLCWCYQSLGVPKWYIKYDDGNFTCCLIYMGVNCACKTLAMPFMQWAPWETIHWFKITEILSSLWNKICRGVEINPSPNNMLVRRGKVLWRFAESYQCVRPRSNVKLQKRT